MVIGIYPRKSVSRDNSDSIQVQIQLCMEYANIIFKDYDIEFKIYDKDEGFSGKNTNRPGFRELMTDVQNGILNAIIVYKLDRISRNVKEFASMYEIFKAHDVAFISVKESFDTSTPIGRTVMYILAAFGQMERENTSERVADSMKALGASGKWTGGKLPTGMTSVRRIVDGKEHSFLLTDEDNIWLAQLLFRLILDGYSITKIERHCRDNGIRSQSGNFLSTSQIHSILTNPVYCQNSLEAYYYFSEKGCFVPDKSLFDGSKGLIAYGRTRTSKDGSNGHEKQDMSLWNIAVGIHKYAVNANDWISAQKRLGINKSIRSAKYDVGILKGVIRCKCGGRMDIRTYIKNGIMFSYHYCANMQRKGKEKCDSGYVRIEKIEEAFLRQLRKIRLNPEGLLVRSDNTPITDVNILKGEIRKAHVSIDNLTAALTQALDTSAASYIIKQIEKLDKEKQTLELSLKKAELHAAACKSKKDTEQEIYENICYLLDNFDQIDYAGKNELIRKTVKKCVFDGKNLHIVF